MDGKSKDARDSLSDREQEAKEKPQELQGDAANPDSFIVTRTGQLFYPLDPKPEHVRIEDIIKSSSKQCRFTGHPASWYSVAEHQVRCSWLVPEGDRLCALIHDAGETYFVDLPRPLKRHPLVRELMAPIEARIDEAVYSAFGLPPGKTPEVERADLIMLQAEQRDLMPEQGRGRWIDEDLSYTIHPWDVEEAEQRYREELYRELARRRDIMILDTLWKGTERCSRSARS